MKPKSPSLRFFRHLSVVMLAAIVLLAFAGCNSKKADINSTKHDSSGTSSGTSSTTTGSTNQTATATTANLAGNPLPFYSLRLEKDSLLKLLVDPTTGKPIKDIKKLIVQVIDSNTTDYNALGLVVYGVKNN